MPHCPKRKDKEKREPEGAPRLCSGDGGKRERARRLVAAFAAALSPFLFPSSLARVLLLPEENLMTNPR